MERKWQRFNTAMVILASISLGSLKSMADVSQSETAATNLVRAHFRSIDLVQDLSRMQQIADRLGEREPLRQAPARLNKNLDDLRARTEGALANIDDRDHLKSAEIMVKSSQAGMVAIIAAMKLRLSQLDLLSAADKASLDSMTAAIQNLTLPRDCEFGG